MTASGVLPTYHRFVNGVPVPLFSRRSFRPREKYLILLVFLTFGVVCFGAFFFLPDFRSTTSGAAAVNSVYKVYQHMQKAGPELLIPAPPHADDFVHPNAIPINRHAEPGQQDIHVLEDKEKLQAKINEEYQQQKTLEKPDIVGEYRALQVTSSASPFIPATNRRPEEYQPETIPPAPAVRLPIVVGGEDKDPATRRRRDKVKEVSDVTVP